MPRKELWVHREPIETTLFSLSSVFSPCFLPLELGIAMAVADHKGIWRRNFLLGMAEQNDRKSWVSYYVGPGSPTAEFFWVGGNTCCWRFCYSWIYTYTQNKVLGALGGLVLALSAFTLFYFTLCLYFTLLYSLPLLWLDSVFPMTPLLPTSSHE